MCIGVILCMNRFFDPVNEKICYNKWLHAVEQRLKAFSALEIQLQITNIICI